MSGNRRKQIAPMKRRTQRLAEEIAARDLKNPDLGFFRINKTEDAIVRPHKQLIACLGDNGSSARTDSRIDDGEVDGPGWKVAIARADQKSRRFNILRRDCMAEIENYYIRIDRKDDT